MSAPIYFFPAVQREHLVDGDGRPVASKLAQYGLAAILGDVAARSFFAANHPTQGPGGRSGCFLATSTGGVAHVRTGFYPDFQVWRQVRRDPELWIGIDKEFPPTPADLVRPSIIRGWPVALADGNSYEIPVIRSVVGRTNLPRDMYRDLDGLLQLEVKPQHADLWDRARALWDRHIPCCLTEQGLSWDTILDECLCFLGVNYRYGVYEQAALRLVDTSDTVWCGILMAVLDRPFQAEVEAAQKKTESLQPGS
jgi:hypothetical protein